MHLSVHGHGNMTSLYHIRTEQGISYKILVSSVSQYRYSIYYPDLFHQAYNRHPDDGIPSIVHSISSMPIEGLEKFQPPCATVASWSPALPGMCKISLSAPVIPLWTRRSWRGTINQDAYGESITFVVWCTFIFIPIHYFNVFRWYGDVWWNKIDRWWFESSL